MSMYYDLNGSFLTFDRGLTFYCMLVKVPFLHETNEGFDALKELCMSTHNDTNCSIFTFNSEHTFQLEAR